MRDVCEAGTSLLVSAVVLVVFVHALILPGNAPDWALGGAAGPQDSLNIGAAASTQQHCRIGNEAAA
jgi:hypothetical protein